MSGTESSESSASSDSTESSGSTERRREQVEIELGDGSTMAAGEARAKVEEMARKGGALVVGVADVASFRSAPEGFRPADLLPEARSVVVVGGGAPRAGDWASPLHEHLETMGTTDRINSLGLKVAKFIEARFGYYALFVPPGVRRGNQPFLSVAYAAELAGCGSRSLAGPVLHPEHGLLFFSAILTTLPLPFDRPLEVPACPAPSCVEQWEERGTTPCIEVCPIADGGCLGGKIEQGQITERRYDAARCTSRVYTHWIPGFQKTLDLALSRDDPEERKMILYSSHFTRTLWSMTYSAQSQAQCWECMRVCPVGAEKRVKR